LARHGKRKPLAVAQFEIEPRSKPCSSAFVLLLSVSPSMARIFEQSDFPTSLI